MIAVESAPHSYALHGMRLRSKLDLRAPLDTGEQDFDVSVEGVRLIPGEAPVGEILAQAWLSERIGYTHVRTADGYTLRYHFSCDCDVDRARKLISIYLDPHSNSDMAALLVSGSVIAMLLVISGATVLHASAVEVGGRALAFVGGSGSGKSTLAAMFCAAGAELICDDVLRVEDHGGAIGCFPGGSEIRLRPTAAPLGQSFPAEICTTTADGRLGVRIGTSRRRDKLELGAVVLPIPSRKREYVQVTRLSPARALLELSSFPRVLGLRDPELVSRQFHGLSALVRRVPVYRAEIPWGPPFNLSVVRDVVEKTGLAGGRSL